MPIDFTPKAGDILRCNFAGMRDPEMIKTRAVMIINPSIPYRSQLVTVVPLSTTPPRHDLPFCVRLSRNYWPDRDRMTPQWAKCDMIYNFRVERLDRFPIRNRQWTFEKATMPDLIAVRRGVLAGLGYTALQIEQLYAIQ